MAGNRPAQTTVLSTGSVASEVSLLFRTKRVSEIRSIESKIREDAEEKSEALRELLGTRYKDLLQAADEMAAIRDASSGSVRDALRDMAKSASHLREHFLKKGGQDANCPAPVTDDLERRKKVHVIGSKLKHIVDSPEVLYAHLESGNVYGAAVRYSLASCNYMELHNTPGLEGVANRFAERRWKQVQVFKDQILSAAEKKLVTPGLDSSVYSNVLASLVILAGKDRDILVVLDGMLASRTGWIDDENRGTTDAVSTRMRKLATIVRDTISCMASVFWSGDDSGVEGLLRDVDADAADEVKRLRESGALKNSCVSWIDSVKGWLEEHGKDILVGADSSRVLADTLRAIDDISSEDRWADDCQAALEKPPKFVFDIFTPFISERAATVASESVQRAVDKVLSDIDSVRGDIRIGSHAGKLIWSAVSNQAVCWKNDSTEGRQEPTSRMGSATDEENEIARALACSGLVSSVIDVFESSLSESLSDVAILAQRVPSVSNAFDDSVRSAFPRILEGVRTHLQSIPITFSDDPASKEQSCDHLIERALFIARIATAFRTADCVRSAYCFFGSVARGVSKPPVVNDDVETSNSSLQEFYETASDLSSAGYKTWANRLCRRLKEQLQAELTSEGVLNVVTGWASTEHSNSGSKLGDSEKSGGLRYPTTASTAAMKFILRACRAANRAGGFGLPQTAIEYLREEMSHAAVHAYGEAFGFYCGDLLSDGEMGEGFKRDGNERADTALMQMLFDVLVLQQLLDDSMAGNVSANSKQSLKALEQQLHTAIDPIDLASCRKAIHVSVDGYSSRTCILFGTITRNGLGGSSYLKRPLTTSTQLASSNLVSLSRTVPRFTYLPAPMPSTYSSTGGGTAGLSAKAALGALRLEATTANGSGYRKRDAETSVAEYASKVSESVGRFGRGFFESLTRKVG